MPTFKIAHIREQGTDLIIVPLESRFGSLSSDDQDATIRDLQLHANGAGLAGRVVPVWDSGSGRMAFIAPQQWHPFFSSISLQWVGLNLKKQLSW